jgi:hypothetical protein
MHPDWLRGLRDQVHAAGAKLFVKQIGSNHALWPSVTGKGYCGCISFEADIQPDKVRVCHCTDCQTLSGSAFRTNVPVVQGTFVLKKAAAAHFHSTLQRRPLLLSAQFRRDDYLLLGNEALDPPNKLYAEIEREIQWCSVLGAFQSPQW